MKKRILSLLLCFTLCFSLLPMGAFAEELPNEPLTTEVPGEETLAEDIPAEEPQTEEAPAEEPEAVYYTVSVEDCDDGRLVFSGTEYAPGETVTFTAEAEEGYALTLLELDPETEYTENEDGSFSFVMPEANVTVSAVFAMPILLGNLMANEPVPYIYYTADGSAAVRHDDGVCADYEIISSETTEWSDGWYVAEGNIDISQVSVTDNVNLILKDNCTLTVSGGIRVEDLGSLTIHAESDSDYMGTLISNGVGSNAGIGGLNGVVKIHGGNIETTGGNEASALYGGEIIIYGGIIDAHSDGENSIAGIHGGTTIIYGGTVKAQGTGAGILGTVTINGGTVNAAGGDGAGITEVTINDGNVTASGGLNSAGLGGGYQDGGSVTINGGIIVAQGGEYGAGIGGGRNAFGGNVTIYGGNVTAIGGDGGAGIGMGYKAGQTYYGGTWPPRCEIKIYGGIINATGTSYGSSGIGNGAEVGVSGANVTIYGGDITCCGDGSGIAGDVIIKEGTVSASGYGNSGTGIAGTTVIDGGTVTATGVGRSAGICGGDVTVNGGVITATGTDYDAGISGITVTVNGGTITASGGDRAAGIGGRDHADGCDFTINGGTVTANGGFNAAGIGGGCCGSGGNVTINGGTLTVSRGKYTDVLLETPSLLIGNGCCNDSFLPVSPGTITVSPNIWLLDNSTNTVIKKSDKESWSDVFTGEYVSFTTMQSAASYRAYNTATYSFDTKYCKEGIPILPGTRTLCDGWYIACNDVVLDSVSVIGDVHLILMDGCTMTVKQGLHVNEGNSLTIYDQPDTDGQSNVKGILNSSIKGPEKRTYPAAGIGGDKDNNCGSVTIHGGTIIAEGGNDAAGIGGGRNGSGGNITIYGGNITATGSTYAAGIGSSEDSDCGNITINGGNVIALALEYGAGIGTGIDGSGGTVTINGGTVTATGTTWGAGIGGSNVDVAINGGTVVATGGDANYTDDGAGISANTLTVRGGTVDAIGGGPSGLGISANTLTVRGGTVDAIGGSPSGLGVNADEVTVFPYEGACIRVKTEDNNELDGSPFTQTTDITERLSRHTKVHFDGSVSYIYYTPDGNTAVRHDDGEHTGFITVTGGTSAFENGKWYAVFGSITDNKRINVNGTAHLILVNGATLNATSGIEVSENSTLNIYAQSTGENMGVLNASGIIHGPAIGAYGQHVTFGTVNIHGGKVTANGGANGAGIGSGLWGSGGGSVTIYDGEVTANAGTDSAAGIGGGYFGNGVDVKIYGGEVIASNYDSSNGVGLGAGWGGTDNGTLFLADGVTFGAGSDADSITVIGDNNNASDAFGHAYFVTPYQHDHAYNQKVVDAKYLKSEATCTEAAVYYKSCFCGEASDSETFTVGDPQGHTYGEPTYEWKEDKCTATHVCTVCAEETAGHTETETVTGTYVKDTDATCTTAESGHYEAAFQNEAFAAQQTAADSVVKGEPLGHSFPETWKQYNAEQHKHTCSRCGTEVEYADHDFDGNTCKDCGYVKGSAYNIIVGSNGEWTKGSTTGLAFTSDAPFAKFDSVKVDGSTIAATNYTAEEGSTKITLTPTYLENLSVGSHSIVVVFTDGTASTNFTVKAAVPPVPTTYTVSFDMNGHGTQVEAQSVEDGSKATKPTNPTAEGWTFDGWYVDATFSAAFDFNIAINADTTIYAKWMQNTTPPVPTTYTVSFDMNGHGTQVEAQTVEDGSKATKPTDPTASGWTFDGWYADATFSAAFDFNIAINADTTIYAKWMQNTTPPTPTYTIIVGANGEWTKGSTTGLAFTSDAPFDKFDSVKVDGSTIAATNYTAEEGSTKITLTPAYLEALSVGSHSIVVVSTDGTASTNFTVKAAVPPVPTTYTVSFDMNGHGTQITAQSVESGSKASKPADSKASGYTFGGWYADATCTTKFDFNSAITANTTVYAKWTKNSVTPVNPTTPKTGDSSNIFLWITLLFVSGGTLVGTWAYSRKKKKTN